MVVDNDKEKSAPINPLLTKGEGSITQSFFCAKQMKTGKI
jgi:hypothetical protein